MIYRDVQMVLLGLQISWQRNATYSARTAIANDKMTAIGDSRWPDVCWKGVVDVSMAGMRLTLAGFCPMTAALLMTVRLGGTL